jgi:Xaa-Pro aminopeptidase
VPRADEFQGEYVPAYAERLQMAHGLSAAARGWRFVMLKKAAIFIDGRYVIQVRQQVDEKIFQPFHLIEEPPAAWIAKNLKKGDRLGFDPWLVTADQAKRFARPARVGASFVPVDRRTPSTRSGRTSPRGPWRISRHSPRNSPGAPPPRRSRTSRRRWARRMRWC